MKTIAFALICAAVPVFAACPENPDIAPQLDVLIEQANAVETESGGQDFSRQMWALWMQAPDPTAQELLDRGMRARSSYDFIRAVEAFTTLTEYCPAYAEGFNQRAFISFLREDYAAAVVDLDVALALSPRHVGAQSGRALALMNLGRIAEARLQLLTALENNPWLSERFLLNEGGPLAATGEDI